MKWDSFQIHNYVEEVLGGNTVYLVGGCIRDELLGKETKDYDFATSLSPKQTEMLVRNAGRKPYLVGKRFGTIGFKTPDGKHFLEVTTFRYEEYVNENRKPSVTYGNSIIEDLARRDFTINAIARKSNGKIIDPFNGVNDLINGVIKAVGVPRHRFKEDPLRMLRAARFSSILDARVDDATYNAIKKTSHRILNISKERIVSELDRILVSDRPERGLQLLMDSDVLRYIIPEIAIQKDYNQNTRYHRFDLWNHTLGTVCEIDPEKHLRWAALLHDVAKPFTAVINKNHGMTNYPKHDLLGEHMALDICRRLKMSSYDSQTIASLVGGHLSMDSPLKNADSSAKSGSINQCLNL